MIFPKGGAELEDTVLFGKYQICRIIGRGRRGTVFLARHIALNEYRAIKRVPRDVQNDGAFLREAMVLKGLRHPGIPVIYDYEQDSHYHYLIEEYLEGESLFTLVSAQGNLTRAKTIAYGMELCRIMNYLHSLQPTPILYLDLQPKNILICGGALKLIDFDQAVSAALSGDLKKRFGTVGCAAPEQFTNEPLDARTDIYAIGALLHYMGTGAFPDGDKSAELSDSDGGLNAVIKRCIRPRREERYADAKSVLWALKNLKQGVFAENQISLLRIAAVGSSHGMGATHVSFSLSSYLSGKGISNLYVEQNESGTAMRFASYYGVRPDRYGICRTKDFDLKPRYGSCVKPEQPEYDVYIEDYGTDAKALCMEDGHGLVLLVCGGKPWELRDSVRAARLLRQKKELRIIFNHVSPSAAIALPEDASHLPCFRMPFCPEPERPDAETEEFFEELLEGSRAGDILSKNAGHFERKKYGPVQNTWRYLLKRVKMWRRNSR